MAHVQHHFTVSVVLGGIIVYGYHNNSMTLLGIWLASMFVIGGFLIDVDHIWWYMIRKKTFSFNPLKMIQIIKDAYTFHLEVDFRNFNVINIFHTVEFWILLIVWSYYNVYALYFLLGLLVHLVMDFGYAYYYNAHHEASRCHSLIKKYYLLKKQRKEISWYNMFG